ncbi:MAG TPA: hypothetical protein VNC61_09735 [Acidimicrobiales bacterium]|nr:hypothetical protein [Acidimicrobiales bacterium]
MTDNKAPAERVLDLVVFAPAGLVLVAVEEFPKLVDKGRHRLEGQVRTARLVGQAAVQMGRRQLGQLVSQRMPRPPSPTRSPSGPTPDAFTPEPATAESAPFYDAPSAPTTPAPAVNGNGVLPALAIPGYDSLSASQVVQRLAGLSHSELIEVRQHEQSHRHRRTILNRVEQLLAGVDAE